MKILIVYHSAHGHVFQLARSVAEGVHSIPGATGVLRRVRELMPVDLPHNEAQSLRMPQEDQRDIPYCTLEDLRNAEGLVLGSSGRYGNMSAPMKYFIDSTASLWVNGEMEGKPAGLFTASGTTHGGQEVALLTMMIPLLQLGMIIVGIPFSTPGMLHSEARGGTPYGASTIAGIQNELEPAPEDLEIARALGRRVAGVAGKLCAPRRGEE